MLKIPLFRLKINKLTDHRDMAETHPTILLIEDDMQLGRMLKESLELKKYRVEWQTHAEKALLLFMAKKYDLCLIDIILPGMSGLDFAKEIRKTDFTTPLLFMSAKDHDKDMIEAYCSGGDDYIVKPFSTTELALRIYALLRRNNTDFREPSAHDRIYFGNFTFDYPNRMLCSP
jgi:DNA-binding response OmpR family regulator